MHQVGQRVRNLLNEKLRKHAAMLNVSKTDLELNPLAQNLSSFSYLPIAGPMAMLENRVFEIEALIKPELNGDN